MAESKSELVEKAEGSGITNADELKKDELVETVEGLAALGPFIPEGKTEPVAPKAVGKIVGSETTKEK